MIIYKTTNLIDGKFYIGLDSKNDPYYLGGGIKILRAIKKYGRENFKKEILEECQSIGELPEKEIFWISKLNPPYNISNGGYGNANPSDETRQKLSKTSSGIGNGMYGKKGKLNPFFNKKHSKKTIKILSEKAKERFSIPENHPMYNQSPSKETRQKISDNHADVSGKNNPMYGRKRLDMKGDKNPSKKEEVKKKISESKTGDKNPAKRPEVKEKISKTLKGRIPWNKGKTNIYSEETLKKMSESSKGKSSWNKGLKYKHKNIMKGKAQMSKLAINGGPSIRTTPFPSQNTMDENEISAVIDIMGKGRLSGYRANWGKEFWGGPAIQKLEEEWKAKFNVRHAIPCNSATSGLQIACGAIGIQPGDEVIVTPYSMSCSATAPMIWGGVPVFADIEPDFYCLDPKSVEERITNKTKAILSVSLFGQPYDPKINEIARKYGLFVIEDAAQAIGSTFHDLIPMPDGKGIRCNYAGTLGDIGVYSFNYGKHITCGEGGMIVADNDELAMRCRLIMNHAEAVINDMENCGKYFQSPLESDVNMIGFNMRMAELNAAIISEQLKKFDRLLHQRRNNVQVLSYYLSEIPPITFSQTRPDCTHSYYVCSFQWNSEKADGLHRDDFIKAVKAELPPRIHRESEDVQIGCGYIKPLYRFPIFNIQEPICPICEDLWKNKLFLTLYHAPNSTTEDMMDIVKAFEKVWKYRNELKKDLKRI